MDEFYPRHYRRFGRIASAVLQFLYNRKAAIWVRTLGTPGKALEIGSGAGWMLRALKHRGWKVVGNERSVQNAALALVKDGFPIFAGGIDAVKPVPRFDLIVLMQVLEHLENPRTVLQHCARLLKPGGTLVAVVPNLDSWQARACGQFWFHLDVPRHLFHFTPRSLTLALEAVGLRVMTIRYSSPEHDPYGWMQSVLNWAGFKQNYLTRLLFGIDKWAEAPWQSIGVILVSGLLVVPAIAASVVSWYWRSGALMQVSAVKPAVPIEFHHPSIPSLLAK
jgi:SAM-dependent methyltransferase